MRIFRERELRERSHVTKDRLFVETGEGVLDVKELQLEGKKRMDTASFLRGFQMEDGSFCG